MTTFEIEIALMKYIGPRKNIVIPNVSWGFNMHECDLLVVSGAGYLTEVEIKISAADLKKDVGKTHGHWDDRIKYLYFAIPEKLKTHTEYIPQRAGVLLVNDKKRVVKIRDAVKNKNCMKMSSAELITLYRLGCLRILSLCENVKNWRDNYYYIKKELEKYEKKEGN